jgi:cellulose synthase/poly-beta-1,6-N-acetylglucosamine synthase-like glycosyltransferase
VSCHDEEAYIERTVRAAQAQDWPSDRIEILVSDGMSIDATREILARLAAEDARVRLVDNPARGKTAGLNECVRRAQGDIIVRMDVRAEYAADFVSQCVRALDRTGADTVGGPARPRSRTFFQRCVAAALESPLAIGGARCLEAFDGGWVENVWTGAFRRQVFERIGLFDPNATTNEDAELNQRLSDAGGRVYVSRDIVVHYYPRESARALARQYFKYGEERARTMLKHRKLVGLRPALPFVWLAGELALLATSPWHPLGAWSLGAYALATGAEAVRVVRKTHATHPIAPDAGVLAMPLAVATVWGIFPVLHVSHGAGFAAGLARYALRPDWFAAERLSPNPIERAMHDPTAMAGS